MLAIGNCSWHEVVAGLKRRLVFRLSAMVRNVVLFTIALFLLLMQPALGCDSDAVAIFACQAAHDRKFIELCVSSSSDPTDRYLQYRFGTLDSTGSEQHLELEFPGNREGSFKRFMGATYTDHGIYTQSVRFRTATFSYTVFTRYASKTHDHDAGVEVRNIRTGKTMTISCSESPRFYIFELRNLIACDPETPIGTACIK